VGKKCHLLGATLYTGNGLQGHYTCVVKYNKWSFCNGEGIYGNNLSVDELFRNNKVTLTIWEVDHQPNTAIQSEPRIENKQSPEVDQEHIPKEKKRIWKLPVPDTREENTSVSGEEQISLSSSMEHGNQDLPEIKEDPHNLYYKVIQWIRAKLQYLFSWR